MNARSFPKVPLSACPEAYAKLIVQNFDYGQEAFDLHLLPEFVEQLTRAQEAAAALSDALDATVECNLNGCMFRAHATGARGGFRWRLENDDILLLVGSPKRRWAVTVRYLSPGLWEHGLDALRDRVLNALAPYTRRVSRDFIRVTRVDWCFDFFSPQFSKEFRPRLAENVVPPRGSKGHFAGKLDCYSRGVHGETLTIAKLPGAQLQIYDKTLEIDEASGKTWLYDLWRKRLGHDPWPSSHPRDVWRLECRFGGQFLKERNIRRPHELNAALPHLVAEVLYTPRLSIPNPSDSHRDRWPLHPLWSEALRQFKVEAMLPVGRKVTGRRSALLAGFEKALAGALRSGSVLKSGDFTGANVVSLYERAKARIETDPRHNQKIEAARSRYSDVDEAG